MTTEAVARRGAVVVTGASSGIGEACALHLDRLGFQVFATVLPGEDSEPLRKASGRLTVVDLDVTDAAIIASAASTIAASVGETGLAGLVNNAGISGGSASGPLEFLPIAALRQQFEVNVVGQIAVTQAFLPLVRLGHGRIVVMGSLASQLICPFTSPYCASKAALASLTAALRVELQPWNIPVSLVVPGTIATPIWGRAVHQLDKIVGVLPQEAQNLYGRAITATREFLEEMSQVGSPPDDVAKVVEHALTVNRPKTRYVVGQDARRNQFFMFIAMHDRLRDRLVAARMRLPRHAP